LEENKSKAREVEDPGVPWAGDDINSPLRKLWVTDNRIFPKPAKAGGIALRGVAVWGPALTKIGVGTLDQ
jgi:hypothetical protein